MKQYGLKRILSLMLALVMCFGMVPLNVFAEEAPQGETSAAEGEQPVVLTAESGEENSEKEPAKAAVTFKVVNGTWEEGGTEVTRQLNVGDSVSQIPVPKANEGYGAGDWDPEPGTAKVAEGGNTFTHTFTAQEQTLTIEGCGDETERKVSTGTEVTVEAVVPARQKLTGWTLDGAVLEGQTGETCTFIMPGHAATIKPQFKTLHTITIKENDKDPGMNLPEQYVAGETVTVTAPEKNHLVFRSWKVEADGPVLAQADAAETTFTMVDKDVVLVPEYDEAYDVNVDGKLHKVKKGESLRVEGEDRENLFFHHWASTSDKEVVKKADRIRTVTPEEDMTLVPVYAYKLTFKLENGWWEKSPETQDPIADPKTAYVILGDRKIDYTIADMVDEEGEPLVNLEGKPIVNMDDQSDELFFTLNPNEGFSADSVWNSWLKAPDPQNKNETWQDRMVTLNEDTVVDGNAEYTYTFAETKPVSFTTVWEYKPGEAFKTLPADISGKDLKANVVADPKVEISLMPDAQPQSKAFPKDYKLTLSADNLPKVEGFEAKVEGDQNKGFTITYTAKPVEYPVELDSTVVVPSNITSLEFELQFEEPKAAESKDKPVASWTGMGQLLAAAPIAEAPETVTLKKANDWKSTVKIDRYTADGKEVTGLKLVPTGKTPKELVITQTKDGFLIGAAKDTPQRELTFAGAWIDSKGKPCASPLPELMVTVTAEGTSYHKTVKFSEGSLKVPEKDIKGNDVKYTMECKPAKEEWTILQEKTTDPKLGDTKLTVKGWQYIENPVNISFADDKGWPEGLEGVDVNIYRFGTEELVTKITVARPEDPTANGTAVAKVPQVTDDGRLCSYILAPDKIPEGYAVQQANDRIILFKKLSKVSFQVSWKDDTETPKPPKGVTEVSLQLLNQDSSEIVKVTAAGKWKLTADRMWDKMGRVLVVDAPDGYFAEIKATEKDNDYTYEIVFEKNENAIPLTVSYQWKYSDTVIRDTTPEGVKLIPVEIRQNGKEFESFSFAEGDKTTRTIQVPKLDAEGKAYTYTVSNKSVPGFEIIKEPVTAQNQDNKLTADVTYNAAAKENFLIYLQLLDRGTRVIPSWDTVIKLKLLPPAEEAVSEDTPALMSAEPIEGGGYDVVLDNACEWQEESAPLPVYDAEGKPVRKGCRVEGLTEGFTYALSDHNLAILPESSVLRTISVNVVWQDAEGNPLPNEKVPSGFGGIDTKIIQKTSDGKEHVLGTLTPYVGEYYADAVLIKSPDPKTTYSLKLVKTAEDFEKVGYKLTETRDEAGNLTITLKYEPETVVKTVSVRWCDTYGRAYSSSPDSENRVPEWPEGRDITLNIAKKGETTPAATVSLSAADFKIYGQDGYASKTVELPKTDVNGDIIEYVLIRDQEVPPYTPGKRELNFEPRYRDKDLRLELVQEAKILVEAEWYNEEGAPMVPEGHDKVKFTMHSAGKYHTYILKKSKDNKWAGYVSLPGRSDIKLVSADVYNGFDEPAWNNPTHDPDKYDYHYVIKYKENRNSVNVKVDLKWDYDGTVLDTLPKKADGTELKGADVTIFQVKGEDKIAVKTKPIPGNGYFGVDETVDGVKAEYTVEGGPVYGFAEKPKVTGNMTDGFVITYSADKVPVKARLNPEVMPAAGMEIRLGIYNGSSKVAEVVLNEKNGWEGASEEKLPVYNDKGEEIVYTAIPENPDFTVEPAEDGYFVVNKVIPTKTQEITVVWKDSKGKVVAAPGSCGYVKVKLVGEVKADEKTRAVAGKSEQEIIISKKANWKWKEEVPAEDAAGNKILYRVELLSKVTNYEPSFEKQQTDSIIINMKHTKKEGSSPRTADDSHIGVWAAVCGASLIGIAVMGVVTFRKKKK